MIQTNLHRTTAAGYTREAMRRYMLGNIWWMILPTVIAAVTGFTVDTRFLFIAAMLLFLIFPTVIMIIYFSNLSSEQSLKSLTPKIVIFTPTDIHISYKSTDDTLQVTPPDDSSISFSSITDYRITSTDLIITFHDRSFIIIPKDSLPSPDNDINAIVELIYQNQQPTVE